MKMIEKKIHDIKMVERKNACVSIKISLHVVSDQV